MHRPDDAGSSLDPAERQVGAMDVARPGRGPAVRRSAWWRVLVVVLASLGAGMAAAPAGAADPPGPSGASSAVPALSVTTRPSAATGGAFAVTVSARDAAGAVATWYRGSVVLRSDDRRGPVLPAAYRFTAADRGVHTFRDVVLHQAGLRTLTADDVTDGRPGGTASIRVLAGPVTALSVTAPSRAVAGVPFAVRVAPVDAWQNWVVSYRGTVVFRSEDPLVRSLPAGYTFVAADRGSHTFPGVTLVSTGRFRVVASDASRPGVTGRAPVVVGGAGAALEGYVFSGLDPILGGSTVTVYDAVTNRVLGRLDLPDDYRYRLTGLPAGAIKVGATHTLAQYSPDFANNRDTLAEAEVFTLRPGRTLVQSFEADDFGPYLDLELRLD